MKKLGDSNGGRGPLEYAEFAGRRIERWSSVLVLASHDGHRHSSLHRAHVSGPISLPKNSLNTIRQIEEAELHLKVSKRIIRRQLVVMNPVLFFSNWGHSHVHLHQPRHRRSHRVDIHSPLDHNLSLFSGGDPPFGFSICGDGDGVAVPLDDQRVDFVVPLGDSVCS